MFLSVEGRQTQRHPIAGELVQVDRVATFCPGDVWLAGKLLPRRRQLIRSSIIEVELFRPPVGVLAAIPPRHTTGATHCKIDLLANLIEFLCNLSTGLGAAYDQHSSG